MTASQCLTIGTSKGLFILTSDAARQSWSLTGPHCGGWPINHATADPASGRIWAVGGSDWHGAGVWCSADSGATWTLSKLANGQADRWAAENPDIAKHLGFPDPVDAPYTDQVTAMWSIALCGDKLYAGTKPAALYESVDGGQNWQPVTALNDHPSRPEWEPGGAGLILHTIVTDPTDRAKLWVGISAAGVFSTTDGGQTWERRNRLSNAGVVDHSDHHHGHGHADENHELGLCVHNMVKATASDGQDELLYQQNHHGVFRSQDGGRSWEDMSAGLPSTFGFPIATHPTDPKTVWVLPLNGDTLGRYPPDASAAVWKSTDGGEHWQACRDGLPARNCFFTVLRQAMTTDRASPAGVYFGTNSGSVFASTDEGDSWTAIAEHLPTILCVEAFATG